MIPASRERVGTARIRTIDVQARSRRCAPLPTLLFPRLLRRLLAWPLFIAQALPYHSRKTVMLRPPETGSGGNDGRPAGSPGLAAAPRARAERFPDQADRLVVLHRPDRRL